MTAKLKANAYRVGMIKRVKLMLGQASLVVVQCPECKDFHCGDEHVAVQTIL